MEEQRKNQLIKKENNIFIRIRDFLLRLFGKKNELEANNEDTSNLIEINIAMENVANETFKNENEKKKFFEIYEKVKQDKVKLYNLDNEVLDEIYAMLLEEIKIKEKRLNLNGDDLNANGQNLK